MANFGPGDTVRLKSGGPLMTVGRLGTGAEGRELAWCTWFDEENVPTTKAFITVLLVPDTDAPPIV